MSAVRLRLYLVADPDHVPGDLVDAVRSALAGGVTTVQLRAKSLTDRQILALATRIRAECAGRGALFIVNDRLDIALAADADGVHLGVDDLPVTSARRIAGPDFVIGYSPETDGQILDATAAGVSYLGVGPVYGTATKADAGESLGLAEFSRRCSLSRVPVVGIGGINRSSARAVMDAGASGVAVVSAILGTGRPEDEARELLDQVGGRKK